MKLDTFTCPNCHVTTSDFKIELDQKRVEENITSQKAYDKAMEKRQKRIAEFNIKSAFWYSLSAKTKEQAIKDKCSYPICSESFWAANSFIPAGYKLKEYKIVCPSCKEAHWFDMEGDK